MGSRDVKGSQSELVDAPEITFLRHKHQCFGWEKYVPKVRWLIVSRVQTRTDVARMCHNLSVGIQVLGRYGVQ
jgi:hypothetical protein